MTQVQMVFLTIVLQAITVAIAAFVVVFYFFPDKIVFGAKASIVLGLVLSGYQFISPNLSRLLGIRDAYIKFIVAHTEGILGVTCLIVVGAACWMVVMFGTVVERYKYMSAIDQAINIIRSNQLALPAPEDLAAAFTLMPQRPEVPFILMRSSRLLSFDDRPQNYYAYMQRFMAQVNKDAIAAKFSEFHHPRKLSIDADREEVPILDPIHILTNFAIDNQNPSTQLEWATKILTQYRDRPEDSELRLWRTILETELALEKGGDAATIADIRTRAIASIQTQTDPVIAGTNFRTLAFAADHVYQEALDYLAWLKASGPESDAKLPVQCGSSEEITAIFQRILVMRRRLLARADLLWWRSPAKLNIYYLFTHLSGQKGNVSTKIYDSFNKCAGLMDRIKELYSATAFKQYQDPEAWHYGTPLSADFNGSASITSLRKWVRLGW